LNIPIKWYRGYLHRRKTAKAWSWPPSNTEVKNTSTSPYASVTWCLIKHRDNFALHNVVVSQRRYGVEWLVDSTELRAWL
jgi:hypothetical protein